MATTFKNVKTNNPSNTGTETLYTCPSTAKSAVIIGFTICASASCLAGLKLDDAVSGDYGYLVLTKLLAGETFAGIDDNIKAVLKPGDYIQTYLRFAASDSVAFTLSLMEVS